MGSGQRLGQKTGVNWQREMPGVKAKTHIESRPQTKRPQGLSTWKGGRGLLGRPFPQSSPAFEHSKMKFEILWSAHLGQWAAIIGARCWLFGLKRTWLNAHLRVCVFVCGVCVSVCRLCVCVLAANSDGREICVYLCVCVPTTPHRTSSTTKKEKTPPFSNALTCSCSSVQSMGFCLPFSCKVVNSFNRNSPLSSARSLCRLLFFFLLLDLCPEFCYFFWPDPNIWLLPSSPNLLDKQTKRTTRLEAK